MSYGSLTQTDVAVLEQTLLTLIAAGPIILPLKIVEVGIHTGQTARGIKEFLELRHVAVDYWCVDNGTQSDLTAPFEGAHMASGDSAEVFVQVPFGLDLAFVDGCHCRNHAVLDTLNFGERVRPGGFLLFHDTAPGVQRTMRDPHGPDHPNFYNSVLAAHALMSFPTAGWELFKEAFDPASSIGGMQAYQKTA